MSSGTKRVFEDDLVEVVGAGEIDDRTDRDAGRLEVDEELRQPLVLLVRHHRGAEERDRVVGEVRVGGPHLGAVHAVAAVDGRRPRADGGEVGARVGLAHADGEGQLAPRDGGHEALALRLGAEAEQQRTALPVGDPVGADGRAGRQQLLQHHVPLEERPLVAAVLLGPRHADPAPGAQLAAEGGIEPAPRPGLMVRRLAADGLAEELAHLGA